MLLWPFVFVMTDVINEYFGRRGVRFISWLAAALISYAFLFAYVAIAITPADWWLTAPMPVQGMPDAQAAFAGIFGQGMWVIGGSLIAFMIGQLIDVGIYHRVRRVTGEGKIWLRATGSTLVSQLIDSFVVLYIAFVLGPQHWPLTQFLAVGTVNYVYKFLRGDPDDAADLSRPRHHRPLPRRRGGGHSRKPPAPTTASGRKRGSQRRRASLTRAPPRSRGGTRHPHSLSSLNLPAPRLRVDDGNALVLRVGNREPHGGLVAVEQAVEELAEAPAAGAVGGAGPAQHALDGREHAGGLVALAGHPQEIVTRLGGILVLDHAHVVHVRQPCSAKYRGNEEHEPYHAT